MHGPFDIEATWLGELNETQGPEILHAMIHAEARACEGIDPAKISGPISSRGVKTRDGGIDFTVTDAHPEPNNHGIVKEGCTYYQVKTGGSLKLSEDGKLKDLVLKKASGKGGTRELKPKVRECLEDGGTLVFVLFGNDGPDSSGIANRIKEVVKTEDPSHREHDRIEVWQQSEIVGFLGCFPSIRISVARMTGHYAHSMLEDVAQWEARASMSSHVEMPEEHRRIVDDIKSALTSDPTTPVRVIGRAGAGKTKIVHESIKQSEALSQSAIYAEHPGLALNELVHRLQRLDSMESCIVIVDNCPMSLHMELTDKLNEALGRIALVTIGDDAPAHSTAQAHVISIPPLGNEAVIRILRDNYGLPVHRAASLANFCDGSPQIAHAIGARAAGWGEVDPTDPDGVCERLLTANDTDSKASVDEQVRVLMALSPFSTFGYRGEWAEEGREAVSFVARWTGMGERQVEERIWDLRRRGLLEGDRFLKIVPELLRLWLFNQWVSAHGPCFSWPSMRDSLNSANLTRRFFATLEYATSEYVEDIATEMLDPQGICADGGFATSEDGLRLLTSFAHNAPVPVMKYIESLISNHGTIEATRHIHVNLALVNVLRLVAKRRDCFHGAVNALATLSRTEEEPRLGNGATATLVGLFSNCPDPLSPSGAPPSARFPSLQELAFSEDSHKRSLAIRAIGVALGFPQTRLEPYSDSDSLRDTSAGQWSPATREEHVRCYERAWDLGIQCLDTYEGKLREGLLRTLVGSMAGIVFTDLIPHEEWRDWFYQLIQHGKDDTYAIHSEIVRMLRYTESLNAESKECLQSLLDALHPNDFGGKLRRLVTRHDELWPCGTSPDREASLRDLAKEAVDDPSTIAPRMEWLVSITPQNAHDFGKAIATEDEELKIWRIGLGALARLPRVEQGTGFMSGYLGEASARDSTRAAALIEDLCKNSATCGIAPTIICQSGTQSRRGIQAISDLIDKGKVCESDLLSVGTEIQRVWSDAESFGKLTDAMLQMDGTIARAIALRMIHTETMKQHELPEELCMRVLMSYRPEYGIDEVDYTRWCTIAERAIHSDSRVDECTSWIIEHYQTAGLRHSDDTHGVLTALAKTSPQGFWAAIRKSLEQGDDRVIIAFDADDTRDGLAPIESVPNELILNWAWQDRALRPNLLALLVGPTKGVGTNEASLRNGLVSEFEALPARNDELTMAYQGLTCM